MKMSQNTMSQNTALRIRDWNQSVLRIFVLALLMQQSGSAWPAEEVAQVRTRLASESPSWVGQKVSLTIDLMSSTFFSGTPSFDIPEIPGVIILKVAGSPVVGSETIDGESWSIQQHSFSIYAHRAGRITIPSFPVRFSVAPAFGKPPELQRLTTDPVSFEAKLPPGAEGLSLLIATSELVVDDQWDPAIPDDNKIGLEVGDAIERRISLRANEVPGMALPRIEVPSVDGLATYNQTSKLSDREERGALTGVRIESMTYVCERAGLYVLSQIDIPWWNIEKSLLEKVVLPSVSIEVVQPAGSTPSANDDQSYPSNRNDATGASTVSWTMAISLSVVLLAGLGWFYRKAIGQWLRVRQAEHEQSEAAIFARLKRACKNGNPTAAYQELLSWIEVQSNQSTVVSMDDFFKDYDQASLLSVELDAIQQAVIGRSTSWSGQILLHKLEGLRHQIRSVSEVQSKQILPPLNPG